MAALILWVAAVVTLLAGPGNRTIAGPIKGADFVYFYTIGSLARTHHTESLYDFTALHEAQTSLIADSESASFLPIYPPQTALLFEPLSVLPYRPALFVWLTITAALFAVIVRSAWRPVAASLDDPLFVAAAVAAFPPFWYLITYGQSTIVILTGFWAGWLALERRRPFLAGVAFGLLLLKPQFAIPLAVVVMACGEWAMLLGAVTSAAVQVAATESLLGWSVLKAYAASVPLMLRHAELLEPKPYQMHSLSALTGLLPSWIGLPLWSVIAAAVLVYTVKAWKSDAPVRVRVGVLIVASVLLNPHLTIYDATVLVLPLIWIGAYVQERNPQDAPAFCTIVYWLFVTLLAPTAFAIKVQASVLLMIWMLVRTTGLVLRNGGGASMSDERIIKRYASRLASEHPDANQAEARTA